MPRTRRYPRWILLGIGGLVGLIVLGVGVALAALQTGWGHRLVAHQVERALNGLLRGDIEIGSLEGNLVGRVVAIDVVVSDATGREAIRVPRLEASYGLFSLVSRAVRLRDVKLIEPTITARRDREGKLNLVAIFGGPKENGAPSAWKVVVSHATVTGGKLALDDDLHVGGIDLLLAGAQGGSRLSVTLDRAHARWRERDLVVEAKGALDLEGDDMKIADLVVQAGGSRFAVAKATGRTDGSLVQADVAMEVKRADVLRFVSDLPLRGDFSAAGTISRAGPTEPFQVHLTGTLAGAPWGVEAKFGPRPPMASGSFHIDGVDPAAVWANAPAGKVKVALTADLAGKSVATLRGTARMEASGELGGNRVDGVVADLRVAEGEVRGRIEAWAPGARVDVDGAVDIAARPPVVRSAKIRAKVPQLGRFVGDLPFQGDVVADLTASGPLDDLKVAGIVRGTALRYQDVRAVGLVVDADVSGLPKDLVGHARVEASGVQWRTTMFGAVRADGDFRDRGRHIVLALQSGGPELPYGANARARIDRTPGGPTVIQIGELTLKTRQLTWNGSAGSVTLEPDGGVGVKDLSLASSAGRIQASGQLRSKGDRLDVEVKDARIEDLRQAMAPDAPDVRGKVDARVSLLQRDRRLRQLQAKLSARELELRPMASPLSLDVEASLDGREVQARLSADGGRAGTVKLDVATRAPEDPLDLEAWRRFDERDLRKVHGELAQVDLERLFVLLNQENKPVGTVDATLDIGPSLATLEARIAAAGIVTPYVDRPLSAEVEIKLAQKKVAIDGHVRREGGGEAKLTARIAVPARISHVEEWKRLDVDDVEQAEVVFDGVDPAWIEPVRERYSDIEGKVTGTVAARARGDDIVTADLRLDGVRAAPLTLPIAARLRASLYQQRISIDLESSMGDRPLADVQGTIAAGLDAIRRGRTDAFLAASASAKVRVDALPLELVRKAMSLPVPASGALKVDAVLSGTVKQPVVDTTASLAGGRVGEVSFSKLDLEAHLDPGRFSAGVVAAQGGGGSFQTDVQVNLGNVRDGKVRMKANRFDLSFLALFATERGLKVTKGLLDADVSLDGTYAQHHAQGSLKLAGGDLRLAQELGTFHEVSLEVTLGPGDAIAAKLDTRVGSDGRLKVDGTAALVGLSLREAKGTFESQKLSVSTGKTRADVDSRGSFTGEPQADLYLLTVTLEDGTVSLPKLSGGKLHPTGVPEDVVFVDARGRREEVATEGGKPFLRVRLRTERSILVKSEELRAELEANLNATLSPSEAILGGQIRIESGFAELFGRRWSFQGSTVVFDGRSDPPNPRLDIKLGYEFRTTTLAIGVGGTLEKPELALSAGSGDYDQAQLLGFVLGGSPDDAGPATQRDVSQQALGAGVGLVFGQLRPLLKKVVPVDVVSLQTKSGAKEDTFFTVGKWFFSDLFVAYKQRFGSQTGEQQNTYEGELDWYFARGFRLDLIFGDRGEGSADVLWIHRW